MNNLSSNVWHTVLVNWVATAAHVFVNQTVEFAHYKTKTFFGIAWRIKTKIERYLEVSKTIFFFGIFIDSFRSASANEHGDFSSWKLCSGYFHNHWQYWLVSWNCIRNSVLLLLLGSNLARWKVQCESGAIPRTWDIQAAKYVNPALNITPYNLFLVFSSTAESNEKAFWTFAPEVTGK